MENWALITIIFIVLGCGLILALMLLNQKGTGHLKAGKLELKIDFLKETKAKKLYKKLKHTKQSPTHYWLEKEGKKYRYYLKNKKPVYIGRSHENNIIINDLNVDPKHACIFWENGQYFINNLSLKTPTIVNGKKIVKQKLGNGNKIQIGKYVLIFKTPKKFIHT